MLSNPPALRKRLIPIVVIGCIQALLANVYAQDTATRIVAASAARSDENLPSLRREFEGLTQLLQVQQEELRQQAALLAELQGKLDDNYGPDSHPAVRRIPPVFPAIPAVPLAGAFNLPRAAEGCADCAEPCKHCNTRGCNSDCLWMKIGGQYRLMYNASNFAFHPDTLNNSQESRTFFNQRFRTWLEVHPNDHVEGYIQVEVGHVAWGSNFDFPKTYVGPRWPAADDRVGMELRRGWLGYKNANIGRLRAGIQGWQDSFGQTLASSDWDFSVGGLSWVRDFPACGDRVFPACGDRVFPACGDTAMQFGIFSLFEGLETQSDDAVLLALDLDWKTAKNGSFGFSVYYLPDSGEYSYPTADPYDSAWDVWLGLRATTELGSIPLNLFGIYNTGERKELGGLPTFSHDGAALKLEAGAIPFACGKFYFQTLYSTGDSNPNDNRSGEFRTVAQSARDNFGAQGYWSYLVITSPQGPSDVNDLGLSLQNRGLGLFTAQAKYEYPIYRRLSGNLAVGWLRSDTLNPVSGAYDIGTELANIFRLDFGGGLVADFGVSVLFTGDFYKTSPAAPRPDNLYEAYTRLQLEF